MDKEFMYSALRTCVGTASAKDCTYHIDSYLHMRTGSKA